MDCVCGNELIFNDNSIDLGEKFHTDENFKGNIYPIYYCFKCNKYFDGFIEDGQEIKELDKDFIFLISADSWFNSK